MRYASCLIGIAIFLAVFNFAIYDDNFQTFLINEHSNSVSAEYDHVQILEFFKTGELDLPMTVNEYEHMQDVRVVMNNFTVFSILFILIVGYWYYKKEREPLNFMPIVNSIVIVSAIASLLPHQAFEAFHRIFFPQGNYTFPADSVLITLYPGEYFFAFTAWVIGVTLLILLFIEHVKKEASSL